jgi:predicted anti-sigma-YlaC factor YlaD
MDCAAYHELILADLDGHLPPHESAAVAAHLAGCVPCRNARALEAGFATVLRRPSRIVTTPDAVRERVLAALAGATHEPGTRRRFALPVVAALLALTLGLALLRGCWR